MLDFIKNLFLKNQKELNIAENILYQLRKQSDQPQKHYLMHYYQWEIDRKTRFELEGKLNLRKFNAPICECNEEAWMTIEEMIKSFQRYYNYMGTIANGTVENNINDFLKPICDKYNINVYRAIITSYKKEHSKER